MRLFDGLEKIYTVATSRRFLAWGMGNVVAVFGLFALIAPLVEDVLKVIYTEQNGTNQLIALVAFIVAASTVVFKYLGRLDVATQKLQDDFATRPPKLEDIKVATDVIAPDAQGDLTTIREETDSLREDLEAILEAIGPIVDLANLRRNKTNG